jgi:hypothetical protein
LDFWFEIIPSGNPVPHPWGDKIKPWPISYFLPYKTGANPIMPTAFTTTTSALLIVIGYLHR